LIRFKRKLNGNLVISQWSVASKKNNRPLAKNFGVAESRDESGCRDFALHLYEDFEIMQNYFSYRNQQRQNFL